MTLEAASLITLAARSPDPVRFLDFEFSGSACFTDFFSCSNEDGLAQRLHAIFRTTLTMFENKNRTAHCEAVKEPSIPHAVPIRAQHGLPSAWPSLAGRGHGWMAGECIQKGFRQRLGGQQLLKIPGTIAAVAFAPAR